MHLVCSSRYVEPIVALLIIGNGVMIGLQTDPVHKDSADSSGCALACSKQVLSRRPSWRWSARFAPQGALKAKVDRDGAS